MNNTRTFLRELAQQQSDDRDPTSQLVANALGWDFDHTSQVLEELQVRGLVNTTAAQRRAGDTFLDDWVSLTPEGKALVQALHRDGPDADPPDVLVDRWDRIDLPVLRELARAAESDDGVLLMDDVTRRLELRHRDVARSVDNLRRTKFVDARFGHDNGGEYSFIRLSERGFEATGLWPTPETALERMIAALDTIADDGSAAEDDRKQASGFARWLKSTSTSIGIGVITAAINGQMPT